MTDDREDASIVERRHALGLFTDRLKERRHFAKYVNGTPTPERVLYFHGDGGNGKSLLLDLLRLRYCFQLTPDQWSDICQLDGEAFVEAFECSNKYRIVPCAHLDFGNEPRGNDKPLEDVSALSMLRRQLAREGFRFPLFDYALVLQLQRTGRLSKGKLDEFFGSAGTDFAVEVLNAIETLKGAQLIVKSLRLFGAHIDEDVTLYLKRRKLSEDVVRELEELNPLRELPLRLPGLLAADLADSLRSTRVPHERVVLMFDTHESFWGSLGRREGSAQFHSRDLWLRRLLLALDHSAGIIAVVAGRDPPRWADAIECPIAPERVDLQLVGHLEEADARHYLHLGGIEDVALQGALLRLAEVSSGQYHPLYTGLCGDVVLAARRSGVELTPDHLAQDTATQINDLKVRGRELLHRLLKWCDGEIVDAVEVLSACRSFDEKLFVELGRALNFACTHAAFKQVTAFSFVWQQEGPHPTFRIHDLMRRILRESKSERVLEAHNALAALYRQRAEAGEAAAEAEALYHRFEVAPDGRTEIPVAAGASEQTKAVKDLAHRVQAGLKVTTYTG